MSADVWKQLGVDVSSAVPLEEWTGEGSCAVHAEGFYVFCPPEVLQDLDEYAEGDPYDPDSSDAMTPFSRWRLDRTVALLERHLPPDAIVLDLGCGPGAMTSQMANRLSATFVGVDGSLTAIQRANLHHPNLQFAVVDANRLPFARGQFDAIVMNNLWEHLPAPVLVAQAIRAHLKEDGVLLVSTPSRFATANIIRAAMGKRVGLRSTQHVTEYTVGQVIEQLRFVGFRVDEIDGAPSPPAGTAQKIRRLTLGTILSTWKRISSSHHSFAPTVFFIARKER